MPEVLRDRVLFGWVTRDCQCELYRIVEDMQCVVSVVIVFSSAMVRGLTIATRTETPYGWVGDSTSLLGCVFGKRLVGLLCLPGAAEFWLSSGNVQHLGSVSLYSHTDWGGQHCGEASLVSFSFSFEPHLPSCCLLQSPSQAATI